jgi:hypothetical protein
MPSLRAERRNPDQGSAKNETRLRRSARKDGINIVLPAPIK